MYAKTQNKNLQGVRCVLAVIAVLFIVFFAPRADAAVCEGGILKDVPGGTGQATCNVTSGDGTNVTCSSSGVLTDASGANVGTCATGDLLRDGLFGCNSSKYANVGSTVAIGGVYVPVNDAAVTLNTGYLVYKECILDGVTAKISAAARTQLTATLYRDINAGRSGRARYVQQRGKELREVSNKVALLAFDDANFGVMCPAFKDDVRVLEMRRYIAEENEANSVFACSYPGSSEDHVAALKGLGGLEEMDALMWGPNDPALARFLYNAYLDEAIATARYYQEREWEAGNDFYAVTDDNPNPYLAKILTPSFLVSQGASQAYTSGHRCLEGADELSEMCEKMFTEMVHESMKGPTSPGSPLGGLFGMTQAQNGLPSFVSQMVSEAAGAVRGEALSVAFNTLLGARATELAYFQAKEAAAATLANAITRLRDTEKRCWEMIAYNDLGADKHTCSSLPQGKSCTAVGGGSLTIATSTQFSDAVINASLKQLGLSVGQDAQKSQETLKLLDNIYSRLNNPNPSVQREAIAQLDALVAANVRLSGCPAPPQKVLHGAEDVQCAVKQRDDIAGAIGNNDFGLIADTIRNWGDITRTNNADISWCDINSPAVITKWTNAWKK